MEPIYAELRSTLFMDRSELMRFRQVVVNVVLATDIFDKEVRSVGVVATDIRTNATRELFPLSNIVV